MKALTTKLLTTFVAVLCLCLPYQAHGQTEGETTTKTVSICNKDGSKTYATLAASNGVYSAVIDGSKFPNGSRVNVKVNDVLYKSYYKGFKWEKKYDTWIEALESTTFYKSIDTQDTGIEFNTSTTPYQFPFEEALFTVTFINDSELELSITDPNAKYPVNLLVNGEEHLLCEDVNKETEAERSWPYVTPISVAEGGKATIALKVGNKTYGYAVPAEGNAFVFDAEDRKEQVKSGDLTLNADPLSISTKGTYALAVKMIKNNDGTKSYRLKATKTATDHEMTFGTDNYLAYYKTSKKWVGTATLTPNQELPPFVLTDYTTSPATTTTYWFAQDIDDPKGDPQTAALTTDEPATKAKCITEGTYKFDVTIAADGTARARYFNTTAPVEIKDLYVCVYDKHLQSDGQYYYNEGDFSCDYKVTYQLPDGSYAIALCLNPGQSFYIMNNGVEYRPAAADIGTSFGTADKMAAFTFSPSTDPDRRKHVSQDVGYRMLLIKPTGSDLLVSGYKMTITESNKMEVVKSLSSPEEHGHMADVLVKFTIPEGHTAEEGYIEGYRKMVLNPSGTHALYKLNLKAGQTFEIWRGRAIKDEAGNITGIEEQDRVQYGCKNPPADGQTAVSIVDGDISTLYDQYSSSCKTKTYSVINDGEFNFICFYTTMQKQFSVSRKVKKDRGISIAVYNADDTQYGELVDMQYKNVNRRNLMTVKVPIGGYVKFGFFEDGVFTPFEYYNLGISNQVGYDTPITGKPKEAQFEARVADYADGKDECWYRFRIRLREDGNYCLSYQTIPMPVTAWLYVSDSEGEKEYSANEDASNPGHYVFTGVNLKKGSKYYFVNQKGAKIHNGSQTEIQEATKDGLIWYCAHTSSGGGNPVLPGRNINMFSHLNVGTDYQNTDSETKYTFEPFEYNGDHDLSNLEIDMHIATMSHRYSYNFEGIDYRFVGNCAGIQIDGKTGWGDGSDKYKMVYHPTTGYYTCFLDYLWGDWFIYYYENNAHNNNNNFYAFNLNNVVHELNKPYYLSNGLGERYVSDLKTETPTGTAADTSISKGDDGKIGTSYKDRFMIALAPGASGIIQTTDFQWDWAHSPVYKDVTVVFDPANNVLWLDSGKYAGKPDIEDPYGELYLIFTDVDAAIWNADRQDELASPNADNLTQGKHWVKLTRDENQLGHYTAKGIRFPARKLNETESASHSAYFFSNRIGSTLAETIRYSNNYHAGVNDPYLRDSETATIPDGKDPYGSVFTKLNYNEAGYNGFGSFLTDKKPLELVNAQSTAYAETVYVRRWDRKLYTPYEDCKVPTGETQSEPAAMPHRAADDTTGDTTGDNGTSAGDTAQNDVPILVLMTDEQPKNLDAEKDYVIRAFASEPYTYDVDVHLGRKSFTLETGPNGGLVTSVELVPADGSEQARPTAVVRAAAGHISVTGAQSVSIYTVTGGCLLYDAPAAELDVPHGLYIVVADGHATKHLL